MSIEKYNDEYFKIINKNNDNLKNRLSQNFRNVINGFHSISKEPLKEARWEEINIEIIECSGIKINSTSSGSHKSGCDISCDLGNLSNKTGINEKKNITISSYRLTTVCDKKDNGNEQNIINEILKRDGSFDYYSLLTRNEEKEKKIKKQINYEWFLIPKNIDIMNPNKYKWEKTVDKKGIVNGWKTNNFNGCEMKICFSMSSQLWININKDQIEKYKISSENIEIEKCGLIKYNDLYKINNLIHNKKNTIDDLINSVNKI